MIFALAFLPVAAYPQDSGPARTVGQLRSEARRLLAREVRASGSDPKDVVISSVLVNGDDARLAWQTASAKGTMNLTRIGDRWWDVAADPHSGSRAWQISPARTIIAPARDLTAQYAFVFTFSSNDAPAPVRVTQIYARPPTPAEFLPNHPLAPGWGYANAVCFFDFTIAGGKPVTFKPGTVIDVWFPFVLDDQLEYSVSFFSNDKGSGLIKGSIFDNTVHFVLPQFTLAPDKPLMAEIDGDPKPSH